MARQAEAAKEQAKEQEDKKRTKEIEHEKEATAIRDAAQIKGPEFLKDHYSEWNFSETKDEMTDSVIYRVDSTQQNENGAMADVTGTCMKNGSIQFTVTITDQDGKPTVNVIGKNLDGQQINTAATVRYRINDKVRIGNIPITDFRNKFIVLNIKRPTIGSNEQSNVDPQVTQALALLQAFAYLGATQGLAGVDSDQIWGAMIEFETNNGTLVVSIPVFHPAIQQLYQKCFANSGTE